MNELRFPNWSINDYTRSVISNLFVYLLTPSIHYSSSCPSSDQFYHFHQLNFVFRLLLDKFGKNGKLYNAFKTSLFHVHFSLKRNPPPLSYKSGSPKNAQRKSCQIFVTFPKYVNGVLETTFCSQITFGLTGRWQKWSKLAYFRKGGPCREQYDAKIINTYKCQLQHVARNFLVLFML